MSEEKQERINLGSKGKVQEYISFLESEVKRLEGLNSTTGSGDGKALEYCQRAYRELEPLFAGALDDDGSRTLTKEQFYLVADALNFAKNTLSALQNASTDYTRGKLSGALGMAEAMSKPTGEGEEFARKELIQNISEVIAFSYGKDPDAMAEQVVSLLFNFKGRVIRLLNPSPAIQSEQENEA